MTTTTKPKKRNYLNNPDMLRELNISLQQNKMTDTLVNMLMMLTDRYGNHPKYCNYTYNEDMKAYALLMLCRTWHKFNPKRSDNPFAFFTQCIKHSFFQYLNREKKQRNIRDELLLDSGLNPSNTYMTEYEQNQLNDRGDGDYDGGFDIDYSSGFNNDIDEVDIDMSVEIDDGVEVSTIIPELADSDKDA